MTRQGRRGKDDAPSPGKDDADFCSHGPGSRPLPRMGRGAHFNEIPCVFVCVSMRVCVCARACAWFVCARACACVQVRSCAWFVCVDAWQACLCVSMRACAGDFSDLSAATPTAASGMRIGFQAPATHSENISRAPFSRTRADAGMLSRQS